MLVVHFGGNLLVFVSTIAEDEQSNETANINFDLGGDIKCLQFLVFVDKNKMKGIDRMFGQIEPMICKLRINLM
jgi:hypothetical protein